MNINFVFPPNEPEFPWKFLFELAPHFLWIAVIFIVILIIGPKRIGAALLNARKIGFGGFEIELKDEIADAARAKNVNLSAHLQDQLARRAERLLPIISGTRVLWIDDVPTNNSNEIRLLNRLGVSIDLATNDTEAQRMLAQSVYDFVISDMKRGTDAEAGMNFLPQVTRAMLEPPLIFYVGQDRDVPRGAFGLTTRPDALLHLIMDALERAKA